MDNQNILGDPEVETFAPTPVPEPATAPIEP